MSYATGEISANRFESGQRVNGFVQPTLDCRVLLESQSTSPPPLPHIPSTDVSPVFNIKQILNKSHFPPSNSPNLPPPPRLILSGPIIDRIPNLSIVFSSIIGWPVYRLRRKNFPDLLVQGALAYQGSTGVGSEVVGASEGGGEEGLEGEERLE